MEIDTRNIGLWFFWFGTIVIAGLCLINILTSESKDNAVLEQERLNLINEPNTTDAQSIKMRYVDYMNRIMMKPKWRVSVFFSLVIASLYFIFFMLLSNDDIYKGCVFAGVIFFISYVFISGYFGWFDYHIINVTHIGLKN